MKISSTALMSRSATAAPPLDASKPRGARLVSATGEALPLTGTRITADAQGGIARVHLVQTYVNRGETPLRVSYLLPLPEKAAVSGFSFELNGEVTRGVIQRREDARAAFEEALIEGRSAAILEEESSTLFRQEVGNLPAGAEISITVEVDQKLTWHTAKGAWEWRFPTVVAPRYQGPAVSDEKVQRTEVHVADLPKGSHLAAGARLDLRILDERSGRLESPSHSFRSSEDSEGPGTSSHAETSVTFLGGGESAREEDASVPLDRDIVVRWPVASAAEPGLRLCVDRTRMNGENGAFGLITVVPPTQPPRSVPRDLIVLLDTSGSMGGEPLDQAVEVVSALVDSLGERDHLELLEFSSSVSRWKRGPKAASASAKKSAKRWLRSLRASGATDMHGGILEALALLGPEAQRQVLVVTDGLIGGEEQLVHDIASRLPGACRVHTLGIGHGVNRTLTAGAARAGRGLERIVAPGENPADACAELLTVMERPVVVDLDVDGSEGVELATGPLDVFAASPSLIPVRLDVDASGHPTGFVRLRGRTAEGTWTATLDVAGAPEGSGANAALFAREKVQELETFGPVNSSASETDSQIEALGLAFQIATRRTSWIAITDGRTVDPRVPTRNVEMPHELGACLSAEGLGLRHSTGRLREASVLGYISADMESAGGMAPSGAVAPAPAPMPKPASRSRGKLQKKSREFFRPLRRREEGFETDDLAPMDEEQEGLLTVQARIVLSDKGRLVIVFEAPCDLPWSDISALEVELSDGRAVLASLDPAGSTSGTVPSGSEVRMVLRDLPELGPLSPVAIVVTTPMALRLTLQS